MHLHIFGDAITTTVSGITLKDGCLPSIGEYTHNPRDFLLEPSVWFKVQLLDAVSVDCSRRQISWEVIRQDEGIGDSTELSDKDDDGGGGLISDSGLLTSVCAEEFLALDEVFDGLPVLDCSYRNNVISASQFYEGVVKLLHLYILPSVYLSAAHVHALRSALREQTFVLQTIDEEIDSISRKFESVSQTKKGLRQKFVLGAADGDEIVAYSGSILAQLASDIDEDIREMCGTLEVAQDKVNRRKLNLSDADGLAEARRSRDEILGTYEAWLSAREDIFLRGKNPRKRRKSFESKARRPPEHRVYAELTLLQEELNAKMRSLTDKKVMATGVVESMRRTRDELKGGKESFGADLSGGNGDLDRSLKPSLKSWVTLAEQVRRVLSNSDHVIAATHVTFCACVVARCRAACNERILYETDFGRGAYNERGSSSRSPTSEYAKSNGTDSTDQHQSTIFTAESSRATQETVVVKPGGENPSASDSVPLSPPVQSKFSKSRREFFRKRKKSTTIINPPMSPTGVSNAGPSSPSAVATVRLLDSSFDADAVMIFDEKTDYAKRAIDGLKRDIGHHFETVTESLRRELKQRSETSIWLSYETAFYHETMEDILTLYGLELNAVTRAIGQAIRSLKATDLKFEDSKIVDMLEEDEIVVSVEIQDENTPKERLDRVETHPESTKTGDFDDSSCEEEILRPMSKTVDTRMTVKELIRRFSGVGVEKDRGASLFGRSKLRPTRSVREQNELLQDSSFTAVTVRKSLQLSHLLKNSMVFDQTSTLENAQSVIRECSCLDIPGFLPPKKKPDRGCQISRRTMTLIPEMKHNFRRAFECLSLAVEARSLTAKFKQLTRCLREVSQQISAFCNRLKGRGGEKGPGGDELMDGVIVLLCNLDESLMAQLYVQITMMVDLMPPFFKCSSFNFALVQFFTAFQFVKQQISQKRSRSRSGCDDVTPSYK